MLYSFVSTFGDSQSGIGALGINAQAFVIQLITFAIAFWVLKRFAFKPILKVMDQRRKVIEDGVRLGTEMQKEKIELDAQVEKNLSKARNEADKIIADAQAEAKSTVEQSEQNAKTKAKAILDDANTKIKQDTLLARKKLEKELIGLIGDATEAIIDEKVDPKKDAALIDKAMKAQQ